jgi:hypothetical protein
VASSVLAYASFRAVANRRLWLPGQIAAPRGGPGVDGARSQEVRRKQSLDCVV